MIPISSLSQLLKSSTYADQSQLRIALLNQTMFLIEMFYMFVLVSIVNCVTVPISCNDGDVSFEVSYEFTEPGTYILKYIDASVTRVKFNKLTNSYVMLPNHIRELTISSTRFDELTGCDIGIHSYGVYQRHRYSLIA